MTENQQGVEVWVWGGPVKRHRGEPVQNTGGSREEQGSKTRGGARTPGKVEPTPSGCQSVLSRSPRAPHHTPDTTLTRSEGRRLPPRGGDHGVSEPIITGYFPTEALFDHASAGRGPDGARLTERN